MLVKDAFGSEVDLLPGDEILFGSFSRPQRGIVFSVSREVTKDRDKTKIWIEARTVVIPGKRPWLSSATKYLGSCVVHSWVKTGVNYFKTTKELNEGDNLVRDERD